MACDNNLDLGSDCKLIERLSQLKVLRERTLRLEKIKGKVIQYAGLFQEEEKNILNFKDELYTLEKERDFHTQALQAIDADIESINSLVSDSNTERDILLNELQQLSKEYQPLKLNIDSMREYAGLTTITDEFPELDMVERLPKRNLKAATDDPKPSFDNQSVSLTTTNSITESRKGRKSQVTPDERSQEKGKSKAPRRVCTQCAELIPRTAPSCTYCKSKTLSRKKLKKSRRTLNCNDNDDTP